MTAEAVSETHHPHAPTTIGYAVAGIVTWALACLGLVLGFWYLGEGSGNRWSDIQFGVDVALWVLTPLSLVAAPLGLAVVDALVGRVSAQWVHVIVAGLVAAVEVAGVAWVLLGRPWDAPVAVPGTAFCAAVGRAVVIPFVPAVRTSYPAGTPWWCRFRLW